MALKVMMADQARDGVPVGGMKLAHAPTHFMQSLIELDSLVVKI